MAGLLLLAVVDAVALAVMLTASTTTAEHDHPLQGLIPSFSSGYGVRQHHQQGDPSEQHGEHHVPADGALAHEFLEAHNTLRAKYDVPPLRWSSKLARYARRWSSLRRFDCVMMHSPNSPYGENVFWGTGSDWRAADAVRSWATEGSYFDWRAQACYPGQVCGHFTQLVWNDTEYVGCGRAECFAGGVFITCSYDPPGNWKGEVPLT
ncbi:Pathogenesis-related protein 1A [Dichanthelium oligosanthes]|uniref:Pathogenesis-related protein 1A n=1 Tax=Dichanthelium oligosanthes TaxID=888268 RepID=A0A1E5VXZ5_9POAL|nr:Pathogenesis-related protein 1A [Dichanthelium oligosanthes]